MQVNTEDLKFEARNSKTETITKIQNIKFSKIKELEFVSHFDIRISDLSVREVTR